MEPWKLSTVVEQLKIFSIGDTEPFLSADRIEVSVNWRIFLNQPVFNAISILRPRLQLDKAHFPALIAYMGKEKGTHFQAGKLTVKEGDFSFHPSEATWGFTFENFQVEARWKQRKLAGKWSASALRWNILGYETQHSTSSEFLWDGKSWVFFHGTAKNFTDHLEWNLRFQADTFQGLMTGNLTLSSMQKFAPDLEFRPIQLKVHHQNGEWKFTLDRSSFQGGNLSGIGSLNPLKKSGEFQVNLQKIPIEKTPGANSTGIAGKVDGTAIIQLHQDKVIARANLSSPELQLPDGLSFHHASAELLYDDGTLKLPSLIFSWEEGKVEGKGVIHLFGKEEDALEGNFQNIPVVKWLPGAEKITGTTSRMSGSGNLHGHFLQQQVVSVQMSVNIHTQEDALLQSGWCNIILKNGKVSFLQGEGKLKGGLLSASPDAEGQTDFTLIIQNRELLINLIEYFNLPFFEPYLQKMLFPPGSQPLVIHSVWNGNWEKPSITGAVRFPDQFLIQDVKVERGDISFVYKNEEIKITDFTFHLPAGPEGNPLLSLAGSLTFTKGQFSDGKVEWKAFRLSLSDLQHLTYLFKQFPPNSWNAQGFLTGSGTFIFEKGNLSGESQCSIGGFSIFPMASPLQITGRVRGIRGKWNVELTGADTQQNHSTLLVTVDPLEKQLQLKWALQGIALSSEMENERGSLPSSSLNFFNFIKPGMKESAFSTTLTTHGQLRGYFPYIDGRADFVLTELRVGSLQGSVNGEIQVEKGKAVLTATDSTGLATLHSIVSLFPPHPFSTLLQVHGEKPLNLTRIGAVNFQGDFVVETSGTLSPFQIQDTTGKVTHLKLQLGEFLLQSKREFLLNWDLTQNQVMTEPFELTGENTVLQAQLSISVPHITRITGKISGSLDSQWLHLFYPTLQIEGKNDVDIEFSYDEELELQGIVRVYETSLKMPVLPVKIQQMSGELLANGTEISIKNLRFFMNNGWVAGEGFLQMSNGQIRTSFLALEGKEIDLRPVEGIRFSADFHLNFYAYEGQGYLFGQIQVMQGKMEQMPPASEFSGFPEVPVFLDLTVDIWDNFFLRVHPIQSELYGSVNILGTLSDPHATGRLEIKPTGKIRLGSKDFQVQSGYVDFTGESFLPRVYLTAWAEESPYQFQMEIQGQAPDLRVSLFSTPSLPQEDILALLYTGRRLSDFQGGPQNLPAEALSLSFSALLSQNLERGFFQRVVIPPSLFGKSAGQTSLLTLGKSIGSKLFITHSTDLEAGKESTTELSYRFRPNWEFILQRDEEREPGIVLKYQGLMGKKKTPFFSFSLPHKIREIQLQSDLNEPYHSQLLSFIPYKAGDPIRTAQQSQIRESILQWLHSHGYLQAFVNVSLEELPDGVNIQIRVNAGAIKEVQIEGVEEPDRRALENRIREIWKEAISDRSFAAEAIQEIQHFYQERGYLFAESRIKLEREAEKTRAIITIAKGRLQRVETVQFVGASPDFQPFLRKQMLLKSGSLIVASLLKQTQERFSLFYQDNGFYDVHMEHSILQVENKDTAIVTFQIQEGIRYRLRSVAVQSDEKIEDAIGQPWKKMMRIGEPLSITSVQQAKKELLHALQKQGYLEAAVQFYILKSPEVGEADVLFSLKSGPLYTIQDHQITGVSSPYLKSLIEKEVVFHPGEPLNLEKLEETRWNISSTGLFQSVRVTYTKGMRESSQSNLVPCHVQIYAEENTSISLVARGGWNASQGADISIYLTDYNWAHSGKQAYIQGEASERVLTSGLGLSTPRLWARNQQGSVSLLFQREKQAAFTLSRENAIVEFRRTPQRFNQFTIRLNLEKARYSDFTGDPTSFPRKDEFLSSLTFSYLRDRRDDFLFPSHGDLLITSLKTSGDFMGSQRDFVRTYFQYTRFQPLPSHLTLATGVRLGLGKTFDADSLLPPGERFFAGGDNSLRGFEVNTLGPKDPQTAKPIGGNAMLLLNQELRYRLSSSYGFHIFYDYGNIFRRVADVENWRGRSGAGVGAFFQTPLGPFRLELARNLNPEPTEDTYRIHFGFGFAF